MANEEHLALLMQGLVGWNRWRANNPNVRPDLFGANLNRAYLSEANLSGANLAETDLSGADLSDVDLSGANLSEADLYGADLSGARLCDANLTEADASVADLRRANLGGSNLSRTDLSGANLSDACLRGTNLHETDFNAAFLGGADLSKARADWTLFANIDLRRVKGLERVMHAGPSTIGIDTIYKSKGAIPEVFLRGCGVPDEMITFMHSLVAASAIQFYSCFISYSSKNQEFAERLHNDLQGKNVRCWYAPEDMKIGDKIWDRLDQSIRIHDKLLLILSEQSIGSDWVEDEVTTAFEEERKRGKTVLFPLRLDDCVLTTPEAWAAKVRQRHIGDFTHWKDHDAYARAFERLLRDLKAEPNG